MAYLAVPQQFENASLIRGESNNLADDRLDKFVLFGGLSLAVRGFWCPGDGSHSAAFIQPNTGVCEGDRD